MFSKACSVLNRSIFEEFFLHLNHFYKNKNPQSISKELSRLNHFYKNKTGTLYFLLIIDITETTYIFLIFLRGVFVM